MHAVRPEGADLVVHHDGGEVSARHVIVAAQAPHAAPLVAPVAEQAAAALSQLTYGAFVSVAVETSETTAMPYDDVYADGHPRPRVRHVHQPGARPAARRPAPRPAGA